MYVVRWKGREMKGKTPPTDLAIRTNRQHDTDKMTQTNEHIEKIGKRSGPHKNNGHGIVDALEEGVCVCMAMPVSIRVAHRSIIGNINSSLF